MARIISMGLCINGIKGQMPLFVLYSQGNFLYYTDQQHNSRQLDILYRAVNIIANYFKYDDPRHHVVLPGDSVVAVALVVGLSG